MITSISKYNRGSDRIFGILFTLVFLLASYFLINYTVMYLFLILAILTSILSIFFKKSLKIPNILWISFGEKLSMVVSPIILFVLFCSVFIPIGFCLKLFKVDNLKLLNYDEKTFWIKRNLKIQPFKKQF